MPAMSASDRARRADDLAPMITTAPVLTTISRTLRTSRMQTGATTPIAADEPMQIWPSSGDTVPPELRTIAAVGGVRIDAYAFARHTTDVHIGYTITTPTTRYKVVGLGRWTACVGLALAELVAQ